jgi:hypothetical protein
MTRGEIYSNYLLENRFHKLLFTLRFAGIPLNIQSGSTIRRAYNMIIVVSFYLTFCSALMDFLVSTHNLKELMKSTRVLLGIAVVMWQHIFLR